MSEELMVVDHYEIVLADLRAKKLQIEQAISAIESLRGGAPLGAGATANSAQKQPHFDDVDSPGTFLGMSISDATKKLLSAKRQTLRNTDIAAAFKRGGLAMNSKDPVNTIGSVLTRRANDVGDIVKVDRGTWGLKEWYPNRNFKRGSVEVREAPKNDMVKVAAEPTATTSGVTREMREKLIGYGSTEEEVDAMSVKEANSILEMFS